MAKMKSKMRHLESECSDHTFALQQLQKEKERQKSHEVNSEDIEHYRIAIAKLEGEKE